MSYSRSEFARHLQEQLAQGYDIKRIARWAYTIHLDARDLEPGLEEVILRVVAMEEGPEFELSLVELEGLVTGLAD